MNFNVAFMQRSPQQSPCQHCLSFPEGTIGQETKFGVGNPTVDTVTLSNQAELIV